MYEPISSFVLISVIIEVKASSFQLQTNEIICLIVSKIDLA